ncbi:MAG: hypothetical protein R3E01_10310 [Pirellulaceae bacterium]|nr:hypothetical protein [Planctomycetales bacterium]
MYTDHTVLRVRALLEAGHSHEEIASQLGVSDWFVNEVSTGRRRTDPDDVVVASTLSDMVPRPYRCRGCGLWTTLRPCVRCAAFAARMMAAAQELATTCAQDPLGLELHGEHRVRYERFHERKQLADPYFLFSSHFSSTGAIVMNLLTNAKYIRWILDNLDHLRPLLDLPDQLRQAESLRERWYLLRDAADLLFELLATFPIVHVAAELSVEALQLEASQQGLDWNKLLTAAGPIASIVELLELPQD